VDVLMGILQALRSGVWASRFNFRRSRVTMLLAGWCLCNRGKDLCMKSLEMKIRVRDKCDDFCPSMKLPALRVVVMSVRTSFTILSYGI
jgi:hypothetical protein